MHPLLNLSLLLAGVALQLGLILLLWRRNLARSLLLFLLILAFYAGRSIFLYTASTHLGRPELSIVYNVLLFSDFLLQAALLATIAAELMFHGRGNRAARTASLVAAIALALLTARAAGALLPPHGRVSVDRVQAGLSALFLLLFVWAVLSHMRGPLRRVLNGFAAYSLLGLVAVVERYFAALHRDGAAYAGWAYAVSACYLLVLLYWIAFLRGSAPLRPALRSGIDDEARAAAARG